jgi:hypothetical protein
VKLPKSIVDNAAFFSTADMVKARVCLGDPVVLQRVGRPVEEADEACLVTSALSIKELKRFSKNT